MTSPVSGWYPDPSGQPGERWWNGAGWTNDTRPAPAPAPAPPPVPAYAPQAWDGFGNVAPPRVDPSVPVPPYRSTPDDGYGRNYAPQDTTTTGRPSWAARNGYSLATVVVTLVYVLILVFAHLAVLGILPLFLGIRAVRRREPLAWAAVVIGVGALVLGVFEYTRLR